VQEDYSPRRKYADERRIMGFSVREHLMAVYRPLLGDDVDVDSRDLDARVGRRVRLGGLLEACRTVEARGGRGTVTFLTFQDEYGLFEATVGPAARRPLPRLDRYGPYVIAGRVQRDYDVTGIDADEVGLIEPRDSGITAMETT